MNRGTRKMARIGSVGLAVAAIIAVLSGCGGEVNEMDQFDAAEELNSTFKTAVGEVQLQIFDGEWEVGEYGDIPLDCDDSAGLSFRMDRTTPPTVWRLDQPAMDAAEQLGTWMNENGWTGIAVRTYDDGIDDVTLKARNEAAGVAELTVNFLPGENTDAAIVRAETACIPGDANTLTEQLIPGWPTDPVSGITRPETERPDATPLFGFTEDGSPR